MRALLLAAALASVAAARPASACAPAPPPGVSVQIAEESAIIVWDEQQKREHFIRRASFLTKGKDFGFLVPTPDKPELAEVADEVFSRLEFATKPDVVYDKSIEGVQPTALCFLCSSFPAKKGEEPGPETGVVRVIGAQRVAGYDTVILEADDPRALADWLKDHGYAVRPELTAWLAPYVAQKWKITAFKIAVGEGAPGVSTGAVRMSFATERPFYPYREPADQRDNLPADAPRERLLRVFFIGPGRVDGTIGPMKAPWPGKPIWSDRIEVAKDLGALPVAVPAGAWLTMFEDKASPRPGIDDVFFAPTADSKPVRPPPIVIADHRKLPLPLDLIGVGALVVGLSLRKSRNEVVRKSG